jgi:HSP20 family protein
MANTANLRTYEPFADLLRVDPFFDTTALFDVPPMRRAWARMPAAPQIKMDIQEDKDAYFVKAEIPGVRKEDIHIMVENNTVTIEATVERKEETGEGKTMLCTELYQGKVTRTFTLATDVDDTHAEAKYENGMLEIKLPKKAGARAKELTVA